MKDDDLPCAIIDTPPSLGLEQQLDQVYNLLQAHSELSESEFENAYRQLEEKIHRQEWSLSTFQFDALPLHDEPVTDTEPRIILAIGYVIYARSAMKSEQPDTAWSHLCEAYRHIGYFDRIKDFAYSWQRKQQLIDRKAAAAKSKSLKLQLKAIELFGSMRPSEGWSSFSKAVKAIKPALEDYMDRDAFDDGAEPVDIAKRMSHYKRSDKLFAAAFNNHATERGKVPLDTTT